MTFMHKLSRRLARLKPAVALLIVLAAACADGPTAGERDDPTFAPNSSLTVSTTNLGDRVRTNRVAAVRAGPAGTAALLGHQPANAIGTIVAGPVYDSIDLLPRWQVDFDTGIDGWAHNKRLTWMAPGTVASVAVTPGTVAIGSGATVVLAAVLRDSAGHAISGQAATWSSSDTLVAAVTQAGLVRGMGPGSATITAAVNGQAGSAAVTVTTPVTSVSVTPASVTLAEGTTVQLTAVATDAGGATVSGAAMTWRSLDTLKARVTAAGLVTGVAAGTALIVATHGTRMDSATINVAAAATTPRGGYYVATSGTTAGDGSITRPWTLAYALAGAGGRILPGDTVWIRGGTYRGTFVSTVSGSSSRPVVIRQYPGERATIDGAGTSSSVSVFRVSGPYTVFWGFEITNSDPVRTTTSTANNVRPNVVSNYANNTKYINLVIHDGGVAFYNEKDYANVEIAGCIFYNNGWQGPDRGHGHAIYLKTNNGPIVARDNIIFNQFGYGIHVYSNAGSGQMNNIRLEGNVAFNNGTLSTNSTSNNILYGGADYATGAAIVDNLTYFSPGLAGTNLRIGYGTVRNGTVTVQGNYAVGGSAVLDLGYWTTGTISANSFIGTSTMVAFNDPLPAGKVFAANTHLRDPAAAAWRYNGSSYTFSGWRSATGLASADLVTTTAPTTTRVVVRPSLHEAGRANITVYNWGRQGAVVVPLGGVLQPGDRFEVRNVQNFFGPAVVSGTYSGAAITIPITGVTPPAPIGFGTSRAPRTGPDFDVFVIVKV